MVAVLLGTTTSVLALSDPASPSASLQPGLNEQETPCGVLWFLHIAKTGGGTVWNQLKAITANAARDEGHDHAWRTVSLYSHPTCDSVLTSATRPSWGVWPRPSPASVTGG